MQQPQQQNVWKWHFMVESLPTIYVTLAAAALGDLTELFPIN